jgi:hypothetical protein
MSASKIEEVILSTNSEVVAQLKDKFKTNTKRYEHTRSVQDPLGLIFLNFALQCHLLVSCGVKILEISAVAVYNFKARVF